MQYILTSEEYQKLTNFLDKRLPSADILQEFCTQIANTMPIEVAWRRGPAQPWGCILTEEEEHYCDECPCTEVCPFENKSWSK